MLPFFQDYLERLEALHRDIWRAIAGLPQEALDWTPGPDMNSIAVLAAHTAGAERYWIGDVIAGDSSSRVRDDEFRTRDLNAMALAALLTEALVYSRAVLEGLALEDLEAARTLGMEEPTTVGWCLAHALEHTAQHLGHIQLTRQLWEHRQGSG